MATVAGYEVAQNLVVNDTRFSNDLSQHILHWPYGVAVPEDHTLIGTRISNVPVSVASPRSLAGYQPRSYYDDWYNRIHIIPNIINVGNLLFDRSFQVDIWNGHRHPEELLAIAPTNADGMTLVEPGTIPLVYPALKSYIYTLDISRKGPPIIDAEYRFLFYSLSEGYTVPILLIAGQRITAWPFEPNWETPVIERLEWLTDLQTSYDGTEQARQLRAYPRRQFEYKLLNRDQPLLKALLWGWQAQTFTLPVWGDRSTLTAAAGTSDSTLYLDTLTRDFQVEGLAMLVLSETQYEVVEIDAVTDTSVSLKQGLVGTWGKNTPVYPARLAQLAAVQEHTGLSANLSTMTVQFKCRDNSDWTAAPDTPTMYQGYYVYEQLPNWRDKLTGGFERKTQTLDYATGIVVVDDESGRPRETQGHHLTLIGRGALASFRAWLYSLKGRVQPIWVPSHRKDLEITTDVVDVEDWIFVKYTGYSQYFIQGIGRRDIRIQLMNNTVYHRRITGSVDLGNGLEQLTLDAALGVNIPASRIRLVSFLQLCRLNADAIELAWKNPIVAEAAFNFSGKSDDI